MAVGQSDVFYKKVAIKKPSVKTDGLNFLITN
ncbi:hypothetical protein BB2000_1433 [Proteus mirabilis BB2000]|nr:hypothetical protein BB2000_1433 [Proteus mirabilis BB2000]